MRLRWRGEIAQKVGGKILENSKQFSQVTTSTDSHGIAKNVVAGKKFGKLFVLKTTFD